MTISTVQRKFTYTGNGATTTFAFPAYFVLQSHLFVTLITVANGTRTPLVLGTDYSVSGAGNLGGGSVTTVVAYSSAFQVELARTVPIVQQTDYQPNDPLPAEIVELDFDYLTMICQQLDDRTTALELAGGSGSLMAMANVGTGTGLIFRDKIGSTFNLKSLKAGAGVTLTNNADDVTIATAAGGIALPGTTNQFYRGDGNFSNTFQDGPFVLDFAASNDTLTWKARAAAVDFKWWTWRLSYPDTLTLWAQKDDFTYVGKALEFVRDVGATIKSSIIGGRVLLGGVVDDGATALQVQGAARLTTPLAIAYGGSGQSTQQNAINALTNVAGATAGQVLAKIGANAAWRTLAFPFYVVTDFGVVGDGTTDNTAAINTMLATVTSGTIYWPQGVYLTTGGHVVPSNVSFTGSGRNATLVYCTSGINNVFVLSGTYQSVRAMQFTASVVRSAGSYLVASGNYTNIEDCAFWNAFRAITISGTSVTVGTSYFYNAVAGTGVEIEINNGTADLAVVSCVMDAPAGSQPKAGVMIVYTGDVVLHDCNIIHHGSDLLLAPPAGLSIASVYCTQCFFDTAVNGMLIQTGGVGAQVVRCVFESCWFSSQSNNGITVSNPLGVVNGLDFINCQLFLNTSSGGFFSNATNVRFVGGQASQNGNHGLVFNDAGASSWSVIGMNCGASSGLSGNTGYGILINAAGVDNFAIKDCDMRGNTIGPIGNSSTGTNWSIVGNLGDLTHPTFINDRFVPNLSFTKGESCSVGAVDTANRALLITDRYLRGSVAGGSFAYTLPAANALGAGISQIIDIKRTDSSVNVLTVQRAGADTVDGLLSVTINPLGALQFRSNGVSSWDVL